MASTKAYIIDNNLVAHSRPVFNGLQVIVKINSSIEKINGILFYIRNPTIALDGHFTIPWGLGRGFVKGRECGTSGYTHSFYTEHICFMVIKYYLNEQRFWKQSKSWRHSVVS